MLKRTMSTKKPEEGSDSKSYESCKTGLFRCDLRAYIMPYTMHYSRTLSVESNVYPLNISINVRLRYHGHKVVRGVRYKP